MKVKLQDALARVLNPHSGRYDNGRTAHRSIVRVIDSLLSWGGARPALEIATRNLAGASYMHKLLSDVPSGEAQKSYVATNTGLQPGLPLQVGGEHVEVIDVGWDEIGHYFIADYGRSHSIGEWVINKQNLSAVQINHDRHCDEQSAALFVEQNNYGQGDAFGVLTRLKYHGAIMSSSGDEGADVYRAQVDQQINIFRGEVEFYDHSTGELVYKAGEGKYAETIGQSRPIINRDRQHTSGTIIVVGPGHAHEREDTGPNPVAPLWEISQPAVIGSVDCGITESHIGQWITVDDPDEFYPGGQYVNPFGTPEISLRQWWMIRSVQQRSDGRVNIGVEATKWGTGAGGGIHLMRDENYSTSSDVPLKYIVSPGAMVSDVTRAISGMRTGWGSIPHSDDERLIKVHQVPNGAPFSAGDRIEQPLGSYHWMPSAYRARHFTLFPGIPKMGSASFAGENLGRTQVEFGMVLRGARESDSIEQAKARQSDNKLPYKTAISLTKSEIVFDCDGFEHSLLTCNLSPGENKIFGFGNDGSLVVTADRSLEWQGQLRSQGVHLRPQDEPATPSVGVVLFVDQEGVLKSKNSAGSVREI